MTDRIYNKSNYKKRRRTLRKLQTMAEKIVWKELRNRQLNGYKFVRQYSVGKYILDFYCAQKRLALELDGSQHLEDPKAVAHDQKRTKYLESENIKVIRVTNNDAIANTVGMLEMLLLKLERR